MCVFVLIASLFLSPVYAQWKWRHNNLGYERPQRSDTPVVPEQRREQQQRLEGPDWVFDKVMARDTR